LILHQHFNTPEDGGAVRSYYLAKALVDRDIAVVVITGYGGATYQVRNVEGIEVHYLPIQYNNRFGFYKRSVSFMRYVRQSLQIAMGLRDVAVCYAISVPLTVGLTALWLKARRKLPFIFEVGDLWPDAPIELGFIKNYFFKQALYSLERFIYRKAESVVALSPMIREAINQKVPGKQIYLIPNMSDTLFYKPEVKDPALEQKFGVSGKFVVSYIGAVGFANGLDYYLECARACQKAAVPVQFLLCGDGAMRAHLQAMAQKLALNNLSFIEFQPRSGVREVMNVTDAVFICYRPAQILQTGSPNKYFDGLAAGKLIVVNFGGWIKAEIERHACGVYTDPRDPSGIVSLLQPFVTDQALLAAYGGRARQLAEGSYSRDLLGDAFAAIFRSR